MNNTTYTDSQGKEYEAVHVTWGMVEKILGRRPEGTDDDKQLITFLKSQKDTFPWISDDCEVWTDDLGWGIIGPKK